LSRASAASDDLRILPDIGAVWHASAQPVCLCPGIVQIYMLLSSPLLLPYLHYM
jgi:hypothetical protein